MTTARDNYYANCPAMNGVSRGLTNYQSSWIFDENLKRKNGIVRDDDYRNFLQMNGKKIMDAEWNELKRTESCYNNACAHVYPLDQNPKSFSEERKRANLVMQQKVLPSNLMCMKYVDSRMTR